MKRRCRHLVRVPPSGFAGFGFPAEVTPQLSDAARTCRNDAGNRWYVDESRYRVTDLDGGVQALLALPPT